MKAILRLAGPVALMYFGIMLMGFVDLMVVGRLGADAIGALGLGNSLFSWVMCVGLGLIVGMDFPAAHAIGAKRPREAFEVFLQALWVPLVAGMVLSFFLLALAGQLDRFGFNPEILPQAKTYLRIIAFSLTPVFAFNVCRAYLQARGIANSTLIILVGANLLNAFLNVGLVYGRFGLPEWGFAGSAWATFISRWAMAGGALVLVYYWDARGERYFESARFGWNWPVLRRVLAYGFPSMIHYLLEVGVFSTATAIAARLTADELAAHQIVLQTASITFMIPLGISSAAAVLVGNAVGAGDRALARRRGYGSLCLGVGFMTFSALVILAFPAPLLAVYTDDPGVIAVARKLLLVAGVFQIFDGAQAVLGGTMRGIGDTRTPAACNLVGHWVFGLPAGLLFAFHLGYGVVGIWWGLCLGLCLVAGSLVYFWNRKSASPSVS